MANWYVRAAAHAAGTGEDTNLVPARTGVDMVANGTTTVTSASGAFTAADVGKRIRITPGQSDIYTIVSVTDASTIVVSQAVGGGTSIPWGIGGAARLKSMVGGVGAGVGPKAGDTIWVGSGVYRDEYVPLQAAGAAGNPITLRGDVDGLNTGDPPGTALLTTWATDTTPTGSPYLYGAGVSYWDFRNLSFVSGSGRCVDFTSGPRSLNFTDCAFQQMSCGYATVAAVGLACQGSPVDVTFDRCLFMAGGPGITLAVTLQSGAEYQSGLLVRNSMFVGCSNPFSSTLGGGSGTAKPRAGMITNCTILFSSAAILIANWSVVESFKVQNCVIYNNATVQFQATTNGMMAESYNVVNASTLSPYTNVPAGAGTVLNNWNPLHAGGDVIATGRLPRMLGEIREGSPVAGRGCSAASPGTDLFGAPRPSSADATPGAMERRNAWRQEVGVVRTGANALSVLGYAYHDLLVPVDAVATTVAAWLRRGGTYVGVMPSMQILANPAIGVAGTTVTMAGPADTWEQLSTTVTPTGQGVLTVRLVAASTVKTAPTYADDITVTVV